jgi:uncharacterized pyridoxamine 5'-phosphate oxidase family protein
MNQILENLFSIDRIKRKVFLITRKGKRVAKKVKKVKNINLVPIQSKAEGDEALPVFLLKMREAKLNSNGLTLAENPQVEILHLDLEEEVEIPVIKDEAQKEEIILKTEEQTVLVTQEEKLEPEEVEIVKSKKKPTMVKPMSIRKKKSVKSNQEVE